MKKIYPLHLEHLKEKEFIGFIMFVLELIDRCEAVEQLLSIQIARFRAAYDHLDAVYQNHDAKFLLRETQNADAERDLAFRKLRDTVKLIINFPDTPEKRLAAEKVMKIIEHFGGRRIPNLGMEAKSTSIAAIVDDLNEKLPDELETLGIGSMVDGLNAAQQNYEEKLMAWTKCKSEEGKGEMVEARRRMSEIYRYLITTVNIAAKYDETERFTHFINTLNVEVCHLRTKTHQGQPNAHRSHTKDNDEASDDAETTLLLQSATAEQEDTADQEATKD